MIKNFIIVLLNIIILLFLVIFIETSSYLARKLIGKVDIGWIYRYDSKTTILEEQPCVRMETHPVFSHVPDHRGQCNILGGYAEGPFVRYSKTDKDAIVTLGGSTTSGFYQHYAKGKTWPYLLNEMLINEDYDYQIINGGHGGYSSTQELLQLLLNVRRLDHNIKIVISLNGINDLYLQKRGNFFLEPRVNEMYERQFWIDQSSTPKFLPNILSLVRFLAPKSKTDVDMGIREKNRLNKFKKLSAVEIWELNVKSMNSISKSMGIEYFLFLQPTMGLEGVQSVMPKDPNSNDAVMLKTLLEDNGGFKEGYQAGYRDHLNKVYRQFIKKCNEMDFCIDLTSIAPPNGKNYNNPRHHNENGNQLIAEEILRLLKKNF